MEFSPLGLVVSVAVLVPSLLLVWVPPLDVVPVVPVPRVLGWLERAGQALCVVVPAITRGLPAGGWVIVAGLALAAYYALWARYLFAGRRYASLYSGLGGLPIPMAILPVVVFLAAALWLGNLWIAVAAVVLAAGHIPVALLVRRALRAAGR